MWFSFVYFLSRKSRVRRDCSENMKTHSQLALWVGFLMLKPQGKLRKRQKNHTFSNNVARDIMEAQNTNESAERNG